MESIEKIKLKLPKDKYFNIPLEIRAYAEIDSVEVEGIDYSHDDTWNELKKQSVKAYKKLKEREFYLRHNG
jgi:hypothetical protein